MKSFFISIIIICLCACTSINQVKNDNSMVKNIEKINYFLNRLECHDIFDKCVTKNFDMYISKNNNTLIIENKDKKLIIFSYKNLDFINAQLDEKNRIYFLKENPQTSIELNGNKKILLTINQARESLGYNY